MMKSYPEKIQAFLSQRNIAVTGVSSTQPDAANHIFNKFRNASYTVYAINPKVPEVENTKSYPNLTAIGTKVDGVVIASPPQSARSIIEECIRLGITRVWFHSSVNQGSLDVDAAEFAEKNGMEVIRTGCPLMYLKPVDFPHKCIRFFLNLTGKVPKK
jgi:uncharacterized protein